MPRKYSFVQKIFLKKTSEREEKKRNLFICRNKGITQKNKKKEQYFF